MQKFNFDFHMDVNEFYGCQHAVIVYIIYTHRHDDEWENAIFREHVAR